MLATAIWSAVFFNLCGPAAILAAEHRRPVIRHLPSRAGGANSVCIACGMPFS
jgi:hypothetical protein